MKTRKYQALPFNTNQRSRGGMIYALILLLSLLFPLLVKGQVPSTWSSPESYGSGSLVLDGNGVTYLARHEVPAGKSLTNASKWQSLDAVAPVLAPSTSVPSVTPNTGTIPRQLPNETFETGRVNQAQAKHYIHTPTNRHNSLGSGAGQSVATSFGDSSSSSSTFSDSSRASGNSIDSFDISKVNSIFMDENGSYNVANLISFMEVQNYRYLKNGSSDLVKYNNAWNTHLVNYHGQSTRLELSSYGEVLKPKDSWSTENSFASIRYIGKSTITVQQVDYACDNFSLYVGQTWSVPIGLGSRTLKRNIYIHPQLGILGIDEASTFSQQDYTFSQQDVTLENQSKIRLASFSKDHNQSDECCAGEDLHKEDHEKAGPSPSQPNGPGYVDYKLEWEKAKKDLVAVNQRITEEQERQRKQEEEIAFLEKSILDKREEITRVQGDWDNCIAMGKKLLAELEGKAITLTGLDGKVAGLITERKSIESEITACLLLVKESTEEYQRLEQEYEPVANKLTVPHLKGWHYEAEHGWLYVEVGSYPYVFSKRMDSWLYYKQGSHHPWQYFDYQKQAWTLWQ